jgi:phage tail-like protein
MALRKEDIIASYPVPAYNYRVTIYEGNEIMGSSGSATLGFSEVSGLTVAFEHTVYKNGLSFLTGANIIRGMTDPVRIVLKKGVMRGEKKAFLYDWLKSEDKFILPGSLKKDITIDLCDETGVAIMRWLVKGALPVKMEMPHFSATDNEVAIETLEVVAHSLKVNYSL